MGVTETLIGEEIWPGECHRRMENIQSVYNSHNLCCLKLGPFFSLTPSAWIFEFVAPVAWGHEE